MAYLSVRSIQVTDPTERLYYGFSSTADIPTTPLVVLDDLKPAMFEYYGEDKSDQIYGVVEWADTQPTVANLDRENVLKAQKAIVAFYRGEEVPIDQKRALDGLVEFSSHAIAASQISYVDLSKGQIANAIDRMGLAEEASEVASEDGADTFISERVSYPVYGLAVFKDYHPSSYGREMALENMEGRRVVASAHALHYFSLAVGALYAQHVNHGDDLAGEVADLMNPLIGI